MVNQKTVYVQSIALANTLPLAYVGGTCAIESEEGYLATARVLKALADKRGLPYILKASFDKANRTSGSAYRGPGMEEGLRIVASAKAELGAPALVDVHEPWQAEPCAAVADVLQIPAFLCRQTDLVQACAATGRVVNVKRGQFLPPQGMEHIVRKIEAAGNTSILLTERGSTFGYGDLVADMRALHIMRQLGYPVIFDATHAVQQPGALGCATGGDRRLAPVLARAAAAVGIAGIFFEAHPDPDRALSDGPNSLTHAGAAALMEQTAAIDRAVKPLLAGNELP
ncbi:MAG: 3-deoxy-8-phosphooctulonate synthase [Prevotellaceae bacterium]|jgi:2-dehydro-3-deoxyphosphooctonate aldolase (KDO 8-P synthase)|nr:3-deoxy-8-phosphooctulonate synthase [Prevotellaceae bacterium]